MAKKIDGKLIYQAFTDAGLIKKYNRLLKIHDIDVNGKYNDVEITSMILANGGSNSFADLYDFNQSMKKLSEGCKKVIVNNTKVIVESKKFDKIIRGKLKKMMESLVQLPNGEQKRMSPEEIEQLHYDEVPYEIVQDDIETEVDKETWGDEPEQVEEPVDNSDMISVDDEEVEEDDEPQDIVDFLTKKTEPEEVKPNEPAVLSEFDDLSNEEKKALLLKLAKNDNDLNAILGAYLNKKVEEDAAGSKEVVDELNEASEDEIDKKMQIAYRLYKKNGGRKSYDDWYDEILNPYAGTYSSEEEYLKAQGLL